MIMEESRLLLGTQGELFVFLRKLLDLSLGKCGCG